MPDLNRPLIGRLRLEHALHGALIVVALLVALGGLTGRSLDAGEAERASTSLAIARDGLTSYRYEPAEGGPVLVDAAAVLMRLLGDSDFTARLTAAVFGVAALLVPWLLRPLLGRRGALCLLALLALSPSWTVFSRTLDPHIAFAAASFAGVALALRWSVSASPVWLYAAGACLGVAAASAGAFFPHAPWLLLALIVSVRPREREEEASRARTAAAIATAGVVFLLVWLILYSAFGGDPTYAGILKRPSAWGEPLAEWWRAERGDTVSSWWSLFLLLVVYEPLVLVAGVLAIADHVRLRRVPGGIERAALVWLAGAWIVALLRPGAPATILAQVPPLALLGAAAVARRIDEGRLVRPAALLPLGAAALLTLWSYAAVLLFAGAADPQAQASAQELLRPSVATQAVPATRARIEAVAERLGTGTGTRLFVTGAARWPLSWYLRAYPVSPTLPARLDAPVMLTDPDEPAVTGITGFASERVVLRRRWDWAADAPNPLDLVRFIVFRRPWGVPAPVEATLHVCRDLSRPDACAGGEAGAIGAAILNRQVWGGPGDGRGELREPRDLAIGPRGGLYVADSKNHRIQKLDASGRAVAVWGGEGSDPGRFKDPGGVAVGPDGFVYVADTWNHRIQKLSPEGEAETTWGEPESGFWGPRGIAVDAEGRVFVTDTGNKRVVVFTDEGQRLHTWGGEGAAPGQFVEPVGIAVTPDGEVVVADTGNRRLQFFRPDGTFLRQWRVDAWREFYSEPYLAVDAYGAVYVTDSSANRLLRYVDGQLDAAWGEGTDQPLELDRPIGIAVGRGGLLYISDTHHHRILRLILGTEAQD